ncbi:hypothetical protein DF022_33240 [Burkholderia cepacia]|nr:hypothetical protein DF023_37260 [Burkholderia cepacia]RQT94900.1 hypothetical protein DF022_33240 [Burkholderia cepacia]RQZ72189.1 hypothetical protein DF056_35135 [Burkholderia cepacia]
MSKPLGVGAERRKGGKAERRKGGKAERRKGGKAERRGGGEAERRRGGEAEKRPAMRHAGRLADQCAPAFGLRGAFSNRRS